MLITILVPLIFGVVILSLALHQKAGFFSFWEKLALSFAVGIGSVVILMFLLAIVKIPLTLPAIIASASLFMLLGGAYLISKKHFIFNLTEIKLAFNFKAANYSAIEMILLFFIIIKVVYTYFTALIKPLVDVDAFQFYSIVAKALLYDKTFITPYLSNFISDKPLFAYLSQGWVFIATQNLNDSLIKVISPTLFLCLIIITYSVLKRSYSRTLSLLFAFLASTLPFMVYHVSTAYADFPMTFYYATGTFYLFSAIKELTKNNRERGVANLIVSALLLGLSLWVKRAGLVLNLINLIVLTFYLVKQNKLISQDKLKLIIVPAVIFMLMAGPWLIFGQKGTLARVSKGVVGIEAQVQPGQAVVATPVKPDASMVMTIFFRKVFLYADWQLAFLLFLISLTFFYQRSFASPNLYLLAIILLDLLVIVGQFFSKEMYQWLLDGTLLDRLVMNIVPVLLVFCAESIIPGLMGNSSASAGRVSTKT